MVFLLEQLQGSSGHQRSLGWPGRLAAAKERLDRTRQTAVNMFERRRRTVDLPGPYLAGSGLDGQVVVGDDTIQDSEHGLKPGAPGFCTLGGGMIQQPAPRGFGQFWNKAQAVEILRASIDEGIALGRVGT